MIKFITKRLLRDVDDTRHLSKSGRKMGNSPNSKMWRLLHITKDEFIKLLKNKAGDVTTPSNKTAFAIKKKLLRLNKKHDKIL